MNTGDLGDLRKLFRAELERLERERDQSDTAVSKEVLTGIEALKKGQAENSHAIRNMHDRMFVDNGRLSFSSRLKAVEVRLEARAAAVPAPVWAALIALMSALAGFITWMVGQ